MIDINIYNNISYTEAYSKHYILLKKIEYIYDIISKGIDIKNTNYISDTILYYLYCYINLQLSISSIFVARNSSIPENYTDFLKEPYKTNFKIAEQENNRLFCNAMINIRNIIRKLLLSIKFYQDILKKDDTLNELLKMKINYIATVDRDTKYKIEEIQINDKNKVAKYLFENKKDFNTILEKLGLELSFFFVIPPSDSLYETKVPEPVRENKEPVRVNKETVGENKEPVRVNKEPVRVNKEPVRENKKYIEQIDKRKIIDFKVNCYGGTNKTKTNEKFQYNKKNYIIYKGSSGGRYIQLNNVFKNIKRII